MSKNETGTPTVEFVKVIPVGNGGLGIVLVWLTGNAELVAGDLEHPQIQKNTSRIGQCFGEVEVVKKGGKCGDSKRTLKPNRSSWFTTV